MRVCVYVCMCDECEVCVCVMSVMISVCVRVCGSESDVCVRE